MPIRGLDSASPSLPCTMSLARVLTDASPPPPRSLPLAARLSPSHSLACRGAHASSPSSARRTLTQVPHPQRGLVKECPLSALAGTRLGIDANHYLRKLLSAREGSDKHDSFTPAIGGAPLTLTAEVRTLLLLLDLRPLGSVVSGQGEMS